MRFFRLLAAVALLLAGGAAGAASEVRFQTVEVYVDSGERPLAAWQIELTEAGGRMTVVGVENGEHAAFAAAPHYDRGMVEAGAADRVIVAAYSLLPAEALPTGRTRVATVHVQVTGGAMADYRVRLVAAGDPGGDAIAARASLQER